MLNPLSNRVTIFARDLDKRIWHVADVSYQAHADTVCGLKLMRCDKFVGGMGKPWAPYLPPLSFFGDPPVTICQTCGTKVRLQLEVFGE